MKFRIQLTDPDGLTASMDVAVQESIGDVSGIDEEERCALTEVRTAKFMRFAKKWFSSDSRATIEFDIEEETATLVTIKRSADHN